MATRTIFYIHTYQEDPTIQPIISTRTQEMSGLSLSSKAGKRSTKIEKQLTTTIQRCYFAVKTLVFFFNHASSSRNQEGCITCPSPQ